MRAIKDLPDDYNEYKRTKDSLGYAKDSDVKTIAGKEVKRTYIEDLKVRPNVKAIKFTADDFAVETANPCNKGVKGDYIVINEHGVLCEADAIHFEKSYEPV